MSYGCTMWIMQMDVLFMTDAQHILINVFKGHTFEGQIHFINWCDIYNSDQPHKMHLLFLDAKAVNTYAHRRTSLVMRVKCIKEKHKSQSVTVKAVYQLLLHKILLWNS